jgi:hypothetical protein
MGLFELFEMDEPAALMLGLLDDEGLALRVVRLALQVDWQLGARLAGEVKLEWQEKTVGLISGLGLPRLLEVKLLGITKSEAAINVLIERVKEGKDCISRYAADALREIPSNYAVLMRLLKHQNSLIRSRAVYAMGLIDLSTATTLTPILIKALGDEDSSVRMFCCICFMGN